MQAVTPVSFVTPDGVERALRSTYGARKRMDERFGKGKSLLNILNEHGETALPTVLYELLYDAQGKPPADLTLEALENQLAPQAFPAILAAIVSCLSQGEQEKNELEPLIEKAMAEYQKQKALELTGSGSGASADNASDSPTNSSGGDTPRRKSQRSSTVTKSGNALKTSARA